MPRQSKKISASSSKAQDETKGGHLKKEDYLTIVTWLTDQKNFAACFGTGKSTSVGRPPKNKVNGFTLMALHLKQKTKDRFNLSSKQMQERFKNYQTKYRKAHLLASSTGFGLTEEDEKKGIKSIFEKLDSMCPYYNKREELFGSQANVTPLYKVDTQDSEAIECEQCGDEEAAPSNEVSLIFFSSSNNLLESI